MGLWFIVTAILLLSIKLLFRKKSVYSVSYKRESSNNIDDSLETIKELRKEIEIIEENNTRTLEHLIDEKDRVFWRSDSQWNFDHFAVPSVLISSDKNVVEANTQFYKNFRDKPISQNIKGFTINNMGKYFDKDFEKMVDKIDFVLETGESSSIDTLEVSGKQLTLYRIYLSRCKIHFDTYVLLQFIKFPVVPEKCKDYSDNVTLGILQSSNKPVLLVDSECNIFDKNFAAIEYLKKHGLTEFNRKLYQIYPTLNSSEVLDKVSSHNDLLFKFMGFKEYTELHVHKIARSDEKYYIIVIMDAENEKVDEDDIKEELESKENP